MPRLACQRCGRQLFSVAEMEAMSPEERRCPRCGYFFNLDRRQGGRRETLERRRNPPDQPGPPEGVERRADDRRSGKPRRDAETQISTRRPSDGWRD